MAFFDIFKGKNKKTETEIETENKPIDTQGECLQAEGLIITPLENLQDEEDISIKISPDKSGMAVMNRAVHRALDVNEVHFQISAGGTMYGKGSLDDEELEEAEEVNEIGEAVFLEEIQEELENEKVEVLEKTEKIEEISQEIIETKESLAAEESPPLEEETKKKGFFAKLAEGLDKTRKSILDNVDNVLGAFTKIDEDLFEELEEVLIMADLGVETTMNIIESLKARVKKERATDPKLVKGLLIQVISEILEDSQGAEENLPSPTVMLVIGVNGVGKTTTIGKLAQSFKGKGKTVLLAAADTFRAAAIDQLEVWGKRADIEVIKQQENADPAAVVFDAVNAAKHRKIDLLICDTAGRLHNKKNLMDELKKIAKVIDREYPEAHQEIYLVLDATTGQNALQQAKLFKEVADITGIILTKLDGTAKGGIVIAIKSELNIPVRYIGVGEGIADLQEFQPKTFAKALFGERE